MLLARYLSAPLATAVARARRGPLRPSWSFLFEVSVALLRDTARRASGLPPEGQRAFWKALRAPPSPVLRRVRREPIEAGPGVRAEFFTPREPHGDIVILFFHGGSFAFGSNDSHAELITRLALAASARVLAVEYRLVPEGRFPRALEDAVAAYRWLVRHGVPARRIVLAGDSAGGNLSITTQLALRERGEPLPAGAIAICPWVDLPRTGGSLEENQRYDWGIASDFPNWCSWYAGGADPNQPLISPIHADLAGLPPLLVLWGELEMLRDQVVEFVARAQAAGVDVTALEHPDMVHDWMTLHAFTPEAQKAFDEVGAFVRRVCAA